MRATHQSRDPRLAGTEPDRGERDRAQMRLAALVMAGTMLVWLAVQGLGGYYGWAAKWAYLADLAAIGAFIWSLLVTWRIWRRRNDA